MKSAASRDAMKVRVDETFKKWPSFDAMPKTKDPGRRVLVDGAQANDGKDVAQADYIKALYNCCMNSVPVGRDGAAIVGMPVANEDEKPVRGRHLVA